MPIVQFGEQVWPRHASFHLGGPRHVQEKEGLARAKLSSVALGTAAVDHPARAKARAEKRRQLKEVAGQFGTSLMEDYLNMVVAHYNH